MSFNINKIINSIITMFIYDNRHNMNKDNDNYINNISKDNAKNNLQSDNQKNIKQSPKFDPNKLNMNMISKVSPIFRCRTSSDIKLMPKLSV